jgi:hypothetical protein
MVVLLRKAEKNMSIVAKARMATSIFVPSMSESM